MIPQELSEKMDRLLPEEGWCSRKKAERIAELVLDKKPDVVVETGVFAGKSLVAIGLALQHNQKGTATGIDPWDKTAALAFLDPAHRDWWASVDYDHIHARCLDNIKNAGLQKICRIVRAESWIAAPMFTSGINMLHIDGNHSAPFAVSDMALYLDRTLPGSVVFIDDMDWPGVATALYVFRDRLRFEESVERCGIYTRL